MIEISCWYQLFFLNGCNFWTTCPSWMNNSSLENYCVVFFKLAFENPSCDTFADVSSFSRISGKICHVASFNVIQPHLMFLVYLLATNWLSVCRSLRKLKNEGSTMFRGSAIQKLEEKCFFSKSLNNH